MCIVHIYCKHDSATQVESSLNFSSSGSLSGSVGTSIDVECQAGFLGGGLTTCNATFGSFSSVTCTEGMCTPTSVPYSDHTAPDSVTGFPSDTIEVTCIDGYTGGGHSFKP